MKPSNVLIVGLLSTTAIVLTGCKGQEDVAIFETVEQCAQHSEFTAEYCAIHMGKAKTEHVRVAPKYTAVADCEADFGAGQCETAPQRTTSGGSVFMPLMMGYMMGHMLGGGSRVATQPLYRSRDDSGSFRTGDNRTVARKTGVSKVPGQFARAASTKTRTVRRGGFGTSARASFGSVRRARGFRGFGS